MSDDTKRRDDRRLKMLLLLDDCLERGITLSGLEVDGMKIQIASMPGPATSETAEAIEDEVPQHPVSYRQKAREDLMRRRAERPAS